MRFSDWSSDVVSSDLHAQHPMPTVRPISRKTIVPRRTGGIAARTMSRNPKSPSSAIAASIRDRSIVLVGLMGSGKSTIRSEEHTSELQSLMRTSYAVFCLKKNNHSNKHITSQTHLH